jgi:hypothetical protein
METLVMAVLFGLPALAILILITRLFGAFMFRIDDVLKALKETNNRLQSISSDVSELRKQGKGKDSDI